MQIRKAIRTMLAGAMILVPAALRAQDGSINTFSPYTFYGIGDLSLQGTTFIRSMGGAGTAYREATAINYLNPASMSAMARKTFLFNFGLEGNNVYLRDNSTRSSYNTFNVRDVAIQFPLAKGLAFGFSITPYSSVGYRLDLAESDPEIISKLGDVRYRYVGEGDITQAKAGLGLKLFKNFSIGAEAVYYFGNIRRQYSTEVIPITAAGDYASSRIVMRDNVSKIWWNVGAQYDVVSTEKRIITLGATYQHSTKLDADITTRAYLQNVASDTLNLSNSVGSDFTLPSTISVGAFYHTPKMSVGVDYVYKNWAAKNGGEQSTKMRLRNTNTIKAGMQYNPNRYDARRYLNRLTYRIGLRYSDYYMSFAGHDISERAITLGLGIPIKMGNPSDVNLGLELGRRGTMASNLVRETYFKFSIGLSLFGSDDWFRKIRYN